MATTSKQVVFMKAKRVYIRPYLETDIPLLVKWYNDHDNTLSFLGNPLPKTEGEERAWLASLAGDHSAPSNIVFMIVLCKGNIPIGGMGLHGINWIDRKAFTGAAIGEKKYRDKGYASEAKQLVLRFAFESLGLNRIASFVIATNLRSIAYNKKCGYQVEGILREAKFSKGIFVDEVYMSILRKDWDKRKKKK